LNKIYNIHGHINLKASHHVHIEHLQNSIQFTDGQDKINAEYLSIEKKLFTTAMA